MNIGQTKGFVQVKLSRDLFIRIGKIEQYINFLKCDTYLEYAILRSPNCVFFI